jgi:hypothetical protein
LCSALAVLPLCALAATCGSAAETRAADSGDHRLRHRDLDRLRFRAGAALSQAPAPFAPPLNRGRVRRVYFTV